MSPEIYTRLKAKVAHELADDWSPHISIICHINRALERAEASEVAADTLRILRRIIEDGIAIPGDLDPNHEFRFVLYGGTPDEVWSRVERQLSVGHLAKHDYRLWFDSGSVTSFPEAKNA